uniref:serine C-palmitoyltransferase n=1 Tax=Aureoumbra lagunensis TaxID=44058 RepID=A0A7S3JXM6_9STRA
MKEVDVEMSQFTELTTYLGYAILILVGHFRDICAHIFGKSRWSSLIKKKDKTRGIRAAPLFKSWENFYARRLYFRIGDVFNRPISSNPGARIKIIPRELDKETQTFYALKKEEEKECINLGSYNYLGFADNWLETCGDQVLSALKKWPIANGSSRAELGTTVEHTLLEKAIAKFIGKEDCIIFNMGYGTNATTIPALVGKNDLILSDALNHASIIAGCRASGAYVRSFKHNDALALEKALKEAIALGMPRTRRPWNKILVMIEGIYSMEGEICDLKNIAAITKKYKAYLYLDEAHSIGALGPTGRGVCEYANVSPNDVTILMGTFTKSFGGMGGYVAADKSIIQYLRSTCPGFLYHDAMSPLMCSQIFNATNVITNTSFGLDKIQALRTNSNFFRSELIKLGLHVYGNYDSPVIPVLLYNPTKIAAFSRECLKRGLAVVVVGFPATSLVKSRARFCISAAHSKQDLISALETIKEVANLIKIRYAVSPFG